MNYIDTAPGYSNSEEVLGNVLTGVTTPLIISTKLGGRPQPFRPQDREGLLQSVEESMRLLGRDYIDILMIHEPDRPGRYAWWTDPVDFYGPVLEVLDELKRDRAGLCRQTPGCLSRRTSRYIWCWGDRHPCVPISPQHSGVRARE